MNYQKKNFQFGTRVRVINVGSDIDGTIGTVTGKSLENVFDVYIVTMDSSKDFGTGEFQSFVMPETCLELVALGSKKLDLKVGDLVQANKDYISWDREEIKPGKTYKVTHIRLSSDQIPYVQLKGVYSSYPVSCLIKVEK